MEIDWLVRVVGYDVDPDVHVDWRSRRFDSSEWTYLELSAKTEAGQDGVARVACARKLKGSLSGLVV